VSFHLGDIMDKIVYSFLILLVTSITTHAMQNPHPLEKHNHKNATPLNLHKGFKQLPKINRETIKRDMIIAILSLNNYAHLAKNNQIEQEIRTLFAEHIEIEKNSLNHKSPRKNRKKVTLYQPASKNGYPH